MEIKIILFIVAMIFIIMILYKKRNTEQKQSITREVRPGNVPNREPEIQQQTSANISARENRVIEEPEPTEPIVIPRTQYVHINPAPSTGFAHGLLGFLKFVLLIATIFAAFGGGFYFGIEFENNRLAKETEEKINRMESEKQRALNEMDMKYNSSIQQYKEQVKKTQQLLQEMQFRYNYGYDDGGGY
ncbi:MAG: hypothetical protein RJA11_1742 [Bacteroidota bacterium]|jgi:hypothetical protein